jgi:hypothetical protein
MRQRRDDPVAQLECVAEISTDVGGPDERGRRDVRGTMRAEHRDAVTGSRAAIRWREGQSSPVGPGEVASHNIWDDDQPNLVLVHDLSLPTFARFGRPACLGRPGAVT